MSKDPKTILLCATRFWVGAGGSIPLTTSTLRSGVRHVARKQGLTPSELNKAERELVKEGLIKRTSSNHASASIALTEAGVKASRPRCERVELPPWDWQASYRGRLDGVKSKRRKK